MGMTQKVPDFRHMEKKPMNKTKVITWAILVSFIVIGAILLIWR